MKNAVIMSGVTDETYSAMVKGTYKCIVYNSTGCSATSNGLKVTKTCKDEISGKELSASSLSIYPNPNNGNFVIESTLNDNSSSEADIQIINMFGQVIYMTRTAIVDGELKQEINLDQNIPSGNYFVRVIASEEVITKQIIVQQ